MQKVKMFIDSGPGLAVILIGSLLAMLLIGSIVIVTYKRCRHRVKRGDGTAINSPESAASNQNEPISPVTIYYGETSFQPRQLMRGQNESVTPDEAVVARALGNLPASSNAVATANENVASAAVATASAANFSASNLRDAQQRNSLAAITFAIGDPHSQPHSAHPGRNAADKSRGSTAEFTKSLLAIAAADRVPPRRSLGSAIAEDLREERLSTAPAIGDRSDGGTSDRRASDGNVRSQGRRTENNASSVAVSTFPLDHRRSSVLTLPTAGGTFSGMHRPLPIPPTALVGARLGSSESTSGYDDEVDRFGAFVTDGHQGRRVSSTSQMSLPATAVRRQLAIDSRHLPRTSWSGPALHMPSF